MFIEVSAKKVEDAIKQGLEQLGLTIDDVTVNVLDQGGFLRKAKVRLTVDEKEDEKSEVKAEKTEKSEKPVKSEKVEKVEKTVTTEKATAKTEADKSAKPKKQNDAREKAVKTDALAKAKSASEKPQKPAKAETASESEASASSAEPAKRKRSEDNKEAVNKALEFVKETTRLMGFEGLEIKQSESQPEFLEITAPERDDSLIIGRHGETLSALSYLAETCVRAEKCHVNIAVDCNGYRDRRAASLSAMARRKADECVRRRRKIKLEPMDRTDRRTVHSALNDDERVTTSSEGKDPYRCVVIFPARNGRNGHSDKINERTVVDETGTDIE